MSHLSLVRKGLLSKSLFSTASKAFAGMAAVNSSANVKRFLSNSSSEKKVVVEIRDTVQWIRLNRPEKYNSLSIDVYGAFLEALADGAKDKSVKMTAVTGTGKYFSSGNDLNNIAIWLAKLDGNLKKAGALATQNTEQFVSAFIDYPKPLIGVINGPAIGIMVTTLGLYDFVIASDTATFSAPFTKLGIVPEGCSSYTFPKIMGPSLAAELLYFNQTIDAQTALRGGLVSRVVPVGELQAQVEKLLYDPKTGLVANCFPNSLIHSKSLVRDEETRQILHQVNKREAELLGKCFFSEESAKAMENFFGRK